LIERYSHLLKYFMDQINISNIHPIILQILSKRGLGQSEINEFFSWNLNDLPDLTKLLDLKNAGELILKCISENRKIAVFGDYDVDGTTSCALLYHFFKLIGVEIKVFQPDRFIEGYGLNVSSIDQAIFHHINLLITVDCGITNHEAALYAKEKGVDLIITDHHKDDPDKELPCALVVNPNRRDEPADSPLKCLAGVGVAFALALQVKRLLEEKGTPCPSIYSLLELVAIGTISDLAPLRNTNLLLVRHGLKQITKSSFLGLKKFLDREHFHMPFLPSEHVAFNIGPLINSKGRLDHPQKAFELLTTNDSDIVFLNYNHLENCNNERKRLQSDIFEEAKELIKKKISNTENLISVCYAPHWHEGVIGIVASKLVEEFSLPAIVFTNASEPGLVKASARTAGALNLYECLKQCSDLFIKFGGHACAAGLTMDKNNLPLFEQRIKSIISKIPFIERVHALEHDLDIKLKDISPELLKQLEYLEPFGNANPKPLFRSTDVKILSFEILREKHVRFELGCFSDPSVKLRGISFNYIGSWNNPHPEQLFLEQQKNQTPLWAFYNLGINRWNGNQYIQLQIKKINLGF